MDLEGPEAATRCYLEGRCTWLRTVTRMQLRVIGTKRSAKNSGNNIDRMEEQTKNRPRKGHQYLNNIQPGT